MKLNLTYINRREKVSKAGKPFTSVSIKATQYGDKYISGFGNAQNKNWKVGDEVEVEKVEQKGEYLNFEMPKGVRGPAPVELMAISQKLDAVITNQKRIMDHLSGKNRLDMTSAGTKVPDFSEVDDGLDQINPDEIPFD